MNVSFFLENAAAKFPTRAAVVCGDRRMTYQELDGRSSRLAGAMRTSGLRTGDRVALLFYNGHHFVETYFAALKAGLIAVLANTRLAPPEIAYVLNDSESHALFYGPEFDTIVQQLRGDLSTVSMFVSPASSPSAGTVDYNRFLSRNETLVESQPAADDMPCQILYTSGTTGRPKGALITHGGVVWNFMNTVLAREDPPGGNRLIIGPLFHTAGLNNQLTIHIGLGGTCFLMSKFEPEAVFRTIQNENISILVAAPAVFNLLTQHPSAGRYDTSSVIHLTSGADKLLMETKRRILSVFPGVKGIYNAYGCTETTATATVLKAEDCLRKEDSVGQPVPFLQVSVVDEQERPLPPGQVGELVCKGPVVMQGYFHNSEATQEAIRDGWLHTGDLARMDKEGYFYIVDRKKDMLVSGGENIYPREVEEVLYTHPEIADAAVVGVPDETWGECVKAFVVRKPGSSLDVQGVIDYCKCRLASYKKPKLVQFLDSIPRSPSGKALKNPLREMT